MMRTTLLVFYFLTCFGSSAISGTDITVTVLYDSAVDEEMLLTLQRNVESLAHKKVDVELAMMSNSYVVKSPYEIGEPLPYALTIDPGCGFDPCERLQREVEQSDYTRLYVVNGNGDFECLFGGVRYYAVRDLGMLEMELNDLTSSRKSRKENPAILVYVEGDFESKKPNVTVDDVSILRGESVSIVAKGKPNGGEYYWPQLDVTGSSIQARPEESTTYNVLYHIGDCWSDTAKAKVNVERIVCDYFAEPSIISVLESPSEFIDYNADYKEFTFYPERNTYNYIIQLDSLCAPELFEIELIDPSNGRTYTLESKKEFMKKVRNDGRMLEYDDPQVYELAVVRNRFAYNPDEKRGKDFMTNKLYRMKIVYYYWSETEQLVKKESELYDVVFNQCTK